MDAGRRGLAPADLLRDRIERGEIARMVAEQLAAEFQLVLPDRLRQLIHEAFDEDGVLVDVHAAPESRRDVRIAHRVVDQQVRDRVAERVLCRHREAARLGTRAGRAPSAAPRLADARPRGSTAPRAACAGRSGCCPCRSAPTSLHCMTGWISALRHVLLTRPEQLDRCAGHLLGDQHGLVHVVLDTRRAGRTRRRGRSGRLRTCRPEGLTRPGLPRTKPSPSCVGTQTSHLSAV